MSKVVARLCRRVWMDDPHSTLTSKEREQATGMVGDEHKQTELLERHS